MTAPVSAVASPFEIEKIARWCASAGPFSDLALERATHAFTDTIGCIIAGASDQATIAARKAFMPGLDTGTSAVVGAARMPPAQAALINAVAAHALDYDDNYHGATTHASAVQVPALLAVAQSYGKSGLELLEAYIVGLEAQAWVSSGINPSHYTAGWHATSTIGTIGTAAGVARLLGLDETGIAHALSIAVSMASGVKGQFGTPTKPLHAGLAARNAIEAAQLSASGMRGRLDVLESSQGFKALYGGDYPKGWDGAWPAAHGEGLAIERFGLTTKKHPCCGATHRGIDAVLDLRAEHGFGAQDVVNINIIVTQAHMRNLSYTRPENEMQARFSMQYAVALALIQGELKLSDFTQQGVERPNIRALLALTEISSYDDDTERNATGRLPHHISIRLKDGRRFEDIRHKAKGDAAMPFSDKERRMKFIDCLSFSGLGIEEPEALFRLSNTIVTLDSAALLQFDMR
ncbi:MmgE/PrpD family protein [Brucellaceae bacterium D45D]